MIILNLFREHFYFCLRAGLALLSFVGWGASVVVVAYCFVGSDVARSSFGCGCMAGWTRQADAPFFVAIGYVVAMS